MLGLLLFLFSKVVILVDYVRIFLSIFLLHIFLFFVAILLNISEMRVCKLGLEICNLDVFNGLVRQRAFLLSGKALMINNGLAESVFAMVVIGHSQLDLLMYLL